MKPHDQIEQIVKHMNEDFPTAEFSFGHLFNCPCPVDQQQWYIFTQVPTEHQPYGSGITRRDRYSCGGAGHMGEILADLSSDRFLAWMNRLVGFIDSPRHQRWHRKIHANDCPKCGSTYIPNQIGNDNICSICRHRYPRKEE